MAEEQVDGGSDEGTATGANGNASEPQSDQQPSFDAAKLQSSIDALIGKVDELEARTNGLQSVKDKTTKEVSGLKDKIAEYEQLKERLGADGAIEQIELKQTLAEIKEQLSKSVPTQSPGTGAGGAVNAAQAFAEAGLDLKDPRVSKAMAKDYKDQDALDLATYRLRDQIQSGPGPTPAQGAAIQGKPPVAPDVAGLTQEYINEVAAARGNKSLIKGIQQKYQKLGVNVGNVDFRV